MWQQQHGSIDSTADIRPYATAAQSAAPSSNNGRYQHFHHLHHNNLRSTPPGSSRCATLGRIKTLEMTEYQKDKLLNEANTVKIRVSNWRQSYIWPDMTERVSKSGTVYPSQVNFRNRRNTLCPWAETTRWKVGSRIQKATLNTT